MNVTVALLGGGGSGDGAVEEEEHATRQKPRANAVKSRIMIVPFGEVVHLRDIVCAGDVELDPHSTRTRNVPTVILSNLTSAHPGPFAVKW